MGTKLDVIEHYGTIRFLTSPGWFFVSTGGDFAIFYKTFNPLEENEEITNEIVGFEVADIFTVRKSDIPDIPEKYDVPDTNLKDMTIKEIVMQIKAEMTKENPDRQVA